MLYIHTFAFYYFITEVTVDIFFFFSFNQVCTYNFTFMLAKYQLR